MTVTNAINFLALLAYPKHQNHQDLAKAAMRAYWMRECKNAGTTQQIGKVKSVQQMTRQLLKLKTQLDRRLQVANDCVMFKMGLKHAGADVSLSPQEAQSLRFWATNQGIDHKLLSFTRRLPGKAVSLNELATNRPARYKSDWWCPEVMHLAIALRSVKLSWNEPRPYCLLPRQDPTLETDPGWITNMPFTVETLLLLWPDWIDQAIGIAHFVAHDFKTNSALSPALRGLKNAEFKFPS